MKVLVVDDEYFNRDVIGEIMRDHGHTTDEASSVPAALSLYERFHNYGLVITDLKMAPYDGIGLAVELRKRGYDGPIVLATGNPESVEEFARKHGITTDEELGKYIAKVLNKPFRMEALLAALSGQ